MGDLQFDVATAQFLGQRDCQEDAIVAHFTQGCDLGFVVLADGMGGHAAGDIASKIVVTEVFSELLFQTGDPVGLQILMGSKLGAAAQAANACIADYVALNPATKGMGATLVAPVIVGWSLWWISVGDSPLFLFRNGLLQQLNEDHSLAPQIDFMAAQGLLDKDSARDHPDRNVLTSVLFGQSVARFDCPADPLTLQDGDLLIVASDGLQFLDDTCISATLRTHAGRASADIAQALLAELDQLDDPDQDNVSFCIVKVKSAVQDRAADHANWRRHPVSLTATGQ